MARKLTWAAVAAMAVSAGACSVESTEPVVLEPTAGIIRLTAGNQQINIAQSGEVTGGSLVLRAGIGSTVTAVFLTVNGEVETRITRESHQINISVVGTLPITFDRSTTDPFSGTLTCNVPNLQGQLRVSLYNPSKQHDTWGPFDIPVTVSN